jgi:hypothetical protein
MSRNRRAILLAACLTIAAALPAEVAAQGRRVVRRPAVRGTVFLARPYYRPFYPRPYYRTYLYSPALYGFYGGFAGWYGGYGWYPYYAGFYPFAHPYPYAYGRYYDYGSAAQLKVQPREAQVYIDGYFVGTVDDFDGWLQRLRVAPGGHDLTIYLPGHRTYSQKVLFRPGATVRVEHVMQPLGPGEPEEPKPAPQPRARSVPPGPRQTPPPVPSRGEAVQRGDTGSVTVRVQPADAEILIDGERWESPHPGVLTVELPEGSHHVEVRKDGYRTYSAEIAVRRGAGSSVNVSLSRD